MQENEFISQTLPSVPGQCDTLLEGSNAVTQARCEKSEDHSKQQKNRHARKRITEWSVFCDNFDYPHAPTP